MLDGVSRVHFVGIGGIGMSALAQILMARSLNVSGSDTKDSTAMTQLRELGARVVIGHEAQNVAGAELVIFSTAIEANNVELEEARRQGIPVLHRADLLSVLVAQHKSITITGTHGKTTTSAMVAYLLLEAGMDPTVILGGRQRQIGGNARHGSGEYLVAEADESDRSFLKLKPLHTIVTNADRDHMDEYHDLADLTSCFQEHIQGLPEGGWAVVCSDDPNLRSILKKVHSRVLTYGLQNQVRLQAVDLRSMAQGVAYTFLVDRKIVGEVQLGVRGEHNVLNSLAALGIARLVGISHGEGARILSNFEGTERRLETLGEKAGVLVVDDYAHHPTEIRASLAAVRPLDRRIVVVFQPHRYSRTAYLMEDLAGCFDQADKLLLMDIYPAGEDPIEGVTSARLMDEIVRHRDADYVGDTAGAVEKLLQMARSGDLILTMGAGDVGKVGKKFLAEKD